jgi:hypothetical protein
MQNQRTSQEMLEKRHAHRGNANMILTWIVSLIIIAIVLVIGFTILGNLATQQATSSYGANATNSTQYALSQFPTWFQTIVTVVAASSVLVIVIGSLYLATRVVGGRT